MIVASALVAAAGCTTFEDPQLVIDLRVLAMSSSPPEQMIDIDVDNVPTPSAVLAQLVPTTVCALVADPDHQRQLRWAMTVCLTDEDNRCDPERPQFEIGSGVVEDPETASTLQIPCANIIPDQRLLGVLFDALEADQVNGLGGIDYTVMLQIGGIAEPADGDAFAAKHVRVSPRIPANREANRNPVINNVDGSINTVTLEVPRVRCTDLGSVPIVDQDDLVTLYPLEPDDIREQYVVPTLDGQTAMLTETITYWWYAARGSFTDETTGGPHDLLGNQALLGTQWRAPPRDRLNDSTYVPIWIIQRDERLGVSWYQTCMLVQR
ncbi:MAG: hypothetical protein AB7O24_03260 [Kofleriaceae bacterium]